MHTLILRQNHFFFNTITFSTLTIYQSSCVSRENSHQRVIMFLESPILSTIPGQVPSRRRRRIRSRRGVQGRRPAPSSLRPIRDLPPRRPAPLPRPCPATDHHHCPPSAAPYHHPLRSRGLTTSTCPAAGLWCSFPFRIRLTMLVMCWAWPHASRCTRIVRLFNKCDIII